MEEMMLATKQPVLRRFWYATMSVDHLKDGPKPFTLLGEPIVLFLDAQGKPAALEDRCCHRTANCRRAGAKTVTSSAAATAGNTTVTANW
jgi:phenylpropionate dioxygenase-like ring-hydroxylating dioxygenase large terminal subunit